MTRKFRCLPDKEYCSWPVQALTTRHGYGHIYHATIPPSMQRFCMSPYTVLMAVGTFHLLHLFRVWCRPRSPESQGSKSQWQHRTFLPLQPGRLLQARKRQGGPLPNPLVQERSFPMLIGRLTDCNLYFILSRKKELVQEQLIRFVQNSTIFPALYEIRTFSQKCQYRYHAKAVILRGTKAESSESKGTARSLDPTAPKIMMRDGMECG